MSVPWDAAFAGLGAAALLMTVVWAASVVRRDVSIVDIFWGPAFAVAAGAYLALGGGGTRRAVLVAALVTLWALRLAAHIAWRGRGQGEDPRYAEIRKRNDPGFAVKSLYLVFWLQALLAWVISASLFQAITAPRPAAWTALDAAGLLLWLTGFLFEAVADLQLVRFKSDPANRGRVLDRGLWRYSRHPNYFGEAVLWWGFFLFALATPGSWWTVVSPAVITFLLLRVSGVTLLEKSLKKTKPAYAEYVRRTSAFFPRPPRS